MDLERAGMGSVGVWDSGMEARQKKSEVNNTVFLKLICTIVSVNSNNNNNNNNNDNNDNNNSNNNNWAIGLVEFCKRPKLHITHDLIGIQGG